MENGTIMKKKLSILITSLAGGGAERVVSVILNELKDEFDITLILMNDTIVYDIPKDIKILYLENVSQKKNGVIKILKLPFLAYKYKNICNKQNINTSLSFMYRPNFINILAKLFGLKSKVIISERSTPSKVYLDRSLGSIVGNFLIKKLYSKADIIIPNSKGNSLDLIKNYSIEEKKLSVIENPFDIQKIESLARENIKIDKNNNFVFIMVGRLEENKGQNLVIEAFSKLQNLNTELWILGQGAMEEKLKNLINKLNIKNRVKLLGFDNNPYKYMIKADCFILASRREGFPNVLIEALSCGTPIIATDCYSGPREILSPTSDISFKLINNIEFAKFGILVPVDDLNSLNKAMSTMILDKNLHNNYKNIVRNRAMDFNINKIIKNYKEILWIEN